MILKTTLKIHLKARKKKTAEKRMRMKIKSSGIVFTGSKNKIARQWIRLRQNISHHENNDETQTHLLKPHTCLYVQRDLAISLVPKGAGIELRQ
jgi:hypothetical protein